MRRFARQFAERIAASAGLPTEDIEPRIGSPPRADLGQLAFPCFDLARTRRQAPAAIAAELAASVTAGEFLRQVTSAGPYVNAFLDGTLAAREVLPDVLAGGERFGTLDIGQGGAVTVDFSSPNIAKPFGIHHLRSTVIGNALVRMLRAAGYRPAGINHIGDWGTQFGQLLAMWDLEGDPALLEQQGIDYLLKLYVHFHQRAEADPDLQQTARGRFRDLEHGDPEARRLWTLFRDTSLGEFERVYRMLRVPFDDVAGESFYEDLMPPVLDELARSGLLTESEQATVVDLEEYDLGTALVRKRDGSTLYLTRDLAAADFRHRQYGFVRSLYVVGSAQALHFAQLKKVLELMGRPWHDCIEHVPFGMMSFADRTMSTRRGEIILLEDVLGRAVGLAKDTIERGAAEKGRTRPDDIDELARKIGVGAVIFNDLKNRRTRDVVFNWDEVLSFEGETGPYLQYTAARIASMGARYGREPRADVDFALLDQPDELGLVLAIDALPDSLSKAVDACEPSFVADRVLDIAARFSTLYSRRDWKVLSDDTALTDARMLLAFATRQAIVNGLDWLGIEVPERM